MKPGSLVECVHQYSLATLSMEPLLKFPTKGEMYTVRGIYHLEGEPLPAITLEEITNDIRDTEAGWMEPAFPIEYFREIILPPAFVSELEQVTQQPILISQYE